jgi:hypothetical protein
MTDEPTGFEPQDYPGFEPPTPTEQVSPMGAMDRIIGIFMEPGNTFRALKARPTWLVAFLVMGLFVAAHTLVYTMRVPFETRMQAGFDRTMKAVGRFTTDELQLKAIREEMERQIQQGESLVGKLRAAGGVIIFMFVIALIGAALYFVGVILVGKRITFKQALAVRVYSEVPPVIVSSLLLIVLMYLKSPDEIDPVDPASMLTSNLGPLVDRQEHLVLGTIANNIDLFQIWSLVLAVIGLTIMPDKMKRGPAIGIVVVVWLLGPLLKIGINVFTGGLGF